MGTMAKGKPVETVWIGRSGSISAALSPNDSATALRSCTGPKTGRTCRISPNKPSSSSRNDTGTLPTFKSSTMVETEASFAFTLPLPNRRVRSTVAVPRVSFGLLAIPTQLREASRRRAVAKQSPARLDLLRTIIEPELAKAGLPVELSGMVQVESGAQTFALSPRGARGLWQLMPDTARRYGLTVTTQRDERLDAYKSARAAARYLRTLYAQFGDWSLVFAAYNAGEQTIQRAIDRSGTTDFFQLNRLLPAETRSYVPAVWASFARFSDSGRVPHLGSLLRPKANTRVFHAETTTPSGQISLFMGTRAAVSAGEATVHSQPR